MNMLARVSDMGGNFCRIFWATCHRISIFSQKEANISIFSDIIDSKFD
jgi:hypothetical protein